MPDLGAPLGFDPSTTFFGSGLTLLLSGVALRYGEQLTTYTVPELYTAGGGAFAVSGVILGLFSVLRGAPASARLSPFVGDASANRSSARDP